MGRNYTISKLDKNGLYTYIQNPDQKISNTKGDSELRAACGLGFPRWEPLGCRAYKFSATAKQRARIKLSRESPLTLLILELVSARRHEFSQHSAVTIANFVDRSWSCTRESPLYQDLIYHFDDLSLQIVHLVFKQTETRRPYWLFVLLLGIPAYLTNLYLPHAGSTILAAVKVFSLFWSTLVTSILVYRVSPWHPLANYPGPLLCKLTKFHLAYISFGGKQYLYFYELHHKYGNVVRIG